MDHKERFIATIEREPVDRPACFLGLPTSDGWKVLMKYFGCSTKDEVRARMGDDIYPVEMPYHSPVSENVYTALQFSKASLNTEEHRTLNSPGIFEDSEDIADIDRLFDWPEPEKYISKEACQQLLARAPKELPVLGVVWSAHFQDACAAFGMETALVKMITDTDLYEAIDNRITEFYLRANEIFFEYTKGRLDAVLIGNDFGAQTGLILSPRSIARYVMPNSRRLVEQAHAYGLKVIYHSCGSIYKAIEGLIDIGVDAIHPIQALATDMQAENLKSHFDGRVSFCGGVDTQQLLVHGTPDDVRRDVRRLRELFPTGLIISPSHEALQSDVSPENIAALFDEATKIY